MKGGEVNGNVTPDFRQYPIDHALEIVGIIICSRNHEVGQFDPAVCLPDRIANRIKNGLQVAAGKILMKMFCRSLEVDIGGIHE